MAEQNALPVKKQAARIINPDHFRKTVA